MFASSLLQILAIAAIQFIATAQAQNAVVTPCVKGFGDELNGCGGCNKTKAIEVRSWKEATYIENFDMPKAGVKDGGGYKVWWNVEQPEENCRVLIFDPSSNDAGKNPQSSQLVVQRVPGNIILTTAQSGCFLAQVSRKFFVGSCCGDDCDVIGAIPSVFNQDARRSAPVTRATPPETDFLFSRKSHIHAKRFIGQQCTKGDAISGPYTRIGRQQIAGQPQDCSAPGCEYVKTVTTSVSSTIMSEKVIETQDGGSVTAGVEVGMSFFIGPSVSTSVSTSAEWSKTVTDTMGRTDSQTLTKNSEFRFGLTPGGTYAGFFTPDLRCQKFPLHCETKFFSLVIKKFEMEIELCDPIRDQNNVPQGLNGITTIG